MVNEGDMSGAPGVNGEVRWSQGLMGEVYGVPEGQGGPSGGPREQLNSSDNFWGITGDLEGSRGSKVMLKGQGEDQGVPGCQGGQCEGLMSLLIIHEGYMPIYKWSKRCPRKKVSFGILDNPTAAQPSKIAAIYFHTWRLIQNLLIGEGAADGLSGISKDFFSSWNIL